MTVESFNHLLNEIENEIMITTNIEYEMSNSLTILSYSKSGRFNGELIITIPQDITLEDFTEIKNLDDFIVSIIMDYNRNDSPWFLEYIGYDILKLYRKQLIFLKEMYDVSTKLF